jgi:adenylate kinase family enzyme
MNKYKYILLSFFSLLFSCLSVFSKHFILIAKPGSGKGTFANYIARKYKYIHIGAGDLYRQRSDNNLPASMDILTKIMQKRILFAVEKNQKFILDNAISCWPDWKSWKSFFKSNNLTNDICFIVLEASDQICLNRMRHRIICKKCFNVCKESPELSCEEQKCNECGNKLSRRSKDQNDTFSRKRFNYYYQKTAPLIKTLEESNKYKVIKISSEKDLETLYSIYDRLDAL